MNEQTTIPEVILDCEMATEEETELAEIELPLPAECVPITEWKRKKRNRYLGKLQLLGTIHAEIADTLNAKRKAAFASFFSNSDKYFEQGHDKKELIKLALGIPFDVIDPESKPEFEDEPQPAAV